MLSSRVVVVGHCGHSILFPGKWSGLRRWRDKAPCADRIALHNLHWYLALLAAPLLPRLLPEALESRGLVFPEWSLFGRFLFDGGAFESTEFSLPLPPSFSQCFETSQQRWMCWAWTRYSAPIRCSRWSLAFDYASPFFVAPTDAPSLPSWIGLGYWLDVLPTWVAPYSIAT